MSTSEKTTEKTLNIELKPLRIYTKNSLFESSAPATFLLGNQVQPIINLEVNADVYPLNKDKALHEAVLTLHIIAKHQDKVLWQIKHQQAGLYTLQGIDEEQEKKILNGFCMNQLYSYASAEITRLVNQSGFSALYLDPMNFDQLYRNGSLLSRLKGENSSLVPSFKQLPFDTRSISSDKFLDDPKTF